MAKEGFFDFSDEIGDINFTIDNTSKCYTIPNYDYWASSTLINSSYELNIDKLKKVIEDGKYNKLGIHGLTINWNNAQITINGKNKSINTTPDLLKAIQDAGTTVDLNSNGKLRNSEFTNKYYDLLNRIETLQNELNNISDIQPEIEYVNIYFEGDYDSISSATSMTLIKGDKINLPTATKNDTDQFRFTFTGWLNNSTNETYDPGEQVTIYDDTTFTAEFTTLYHVTFKINNGKILNDGMLLTQYDAYIPYGQTTTLTIEPDEGYDLPTFVDNGIIRGKEVICKPVYEIFECTIDCIEEDTSYTYIGDDPFNGHAYVDLGLPTGTLWATMNIGANDMYDYGNYYMYGKGSTTYNSTDTIYTGTENPLSLTRDTANIVWGGDWHMPTEEQFQELLNTDNCTNAWTTLNGVNGRLFTSKINGNTLFFPACGYYTSSSLYYEGSEGDYWSSSPYNNEDNAAYHLSFADNHNGMFDGARNLGHCVRGVVD